jgi:hypothetical protein
MLGIKPRGTVALRRYLNEMDRRRGGQMEALATMGGDVSGLLTPEQWTERERTQARYDARFLNHPKKQRPKLAPICTRPISVAQVLADTRNPARTLR